MSTSTDHLRPASPLPPAEDVAPVYRFLRDPMILTRVLQLLLSIVILGSLAVAVIDTMALQQPPPVKSPKFALDDLGGLDLFLIVQLLIYLLTVVVFALWTYQANRNCHGFRGRGMRFTPKSAAGWYFVPIINLVRPYQVMKEIWQVSSNPLQWQNQSTSYLLPIWWICWLLSLFLGRAVLHASTVVTDITSQLAAIKMSLVSNIGDAVAAVAALLVISRIISLQRNLVRTGRGQKSQPESRRKR